MSCTFLSKSEETRMPKDIFASHATHWRVMGQGAERKVLALHCSLAHAGVWMGLASKLEGVEVHAPDLPGHGYSGDWDGASDLHALSTGVAAGMLEALVAKAGGPIDVMGHSFGGTVALRLAQDYPQYVRSLVLIEPVLFALARQNAIWREQEAANLQIETLLAEDPFLAAKAFHAIWGNGESLEAMAPRARDYIIDRMHLVTAQTAVLVDDVAGLTRPQKMAALQMPVLLLEGGASPGVVAVIQEQLKRFLPKATRHCLQDARHMLPITHYKDLAPLIAAHLAQS